MTTIGNREMDDLEKYLRNTWECRRNEYGVCVLPYNEFNIEIHKFMGIPFEYLDHLICHGLVDTISKICSDNNIPFSTYTVRDGQMYQYVKIVNLYNTQTKENRRKKNMNEVRFSFNNKTMDDAGMCSMIMEAVNKINKCANSGHIIKEMTVGVSYKNDINLRKENLQEFLQEIVDDENKGYIDEDEFDTFIEHFEILTGKTINAEIASYIISEVNTTIDYFLGNKFRLYSAYNDTLSSNMYRIVREGE